MMKTSIYTRDRFHPDIIRRAVWMYFRFNLSFRDVEELMFERGIDVSYETIRKWVDKFGSTYAKRIKSRCEPPSPVWHLDEVYTKINGKMVYLWRAVDDEGTVLDVVVQRRRNTKAATRLLRKLLRNQGIKPTKIVTDRLSSYGATCKMLRDERTIAPNVHTFQYVEENVNHKGLDLKETHRNFSQPTVKSTISSIIDDT
jgi:transposase-like protein